VNQRREWNFEFGNEFLQLEFIKEIGKIHLRISGGVDSPLSLSLSLNKS
jgi:hypothetical protein